jgi:peptidoglycan LD-endopeptidase LytH
MRAPNNAERGRGWPVALAGLGGFALGAATVLLILWLYGGGTPAGRTAAPAPAPAAPSPADREAAPGTARPPASPAPSPVVPPAASTSDPDLARRRLLVPVQGILDRDLHDTFNESRGGGARVHEALDIMAPRNTPVLAVEDGRIAKLFVSDQGGLTIYQFDPSETYTYYYAHLERYADGLKEGDPVRRGQVLGYVGTSGNSAKDAPHLHFAVFRLTPEKKWWQGTPLNPYPLFRSGDERAGR